MNRVLVWLVLSCSSGMLSLGAAEPAKTKPSSSKKGATAKTPAKTSAKTSAKPAPKATPASTTPATASGASSSSSSSPASTPAAGSGASAAAAPKVAPVAAPERKLEPFLLLPMPKLMGTSNAKAMGGSVTTVFCPAREISRAPYVEVYSDAEFSKLGISAEAFEKKAREAAERLLTIYRPELIKDETGKVVYGVYRGEKEIFPCLMMAPSLGRVFENVFGKELIVAMPDRNALYIFPPNPAVVEDFASDMESRYELSLNAASDEVFVIKGETGEIRALGSFASR